MQLSPLCFVFAAGLATFGIGQAALPTAHAQTAPLYQVAVRNLHTAHTKSGLETTGTLVNTGSGTLTYTSVILVFKSADGTEAAVPAYLMTGPVGPGQSAGFRSASPEMTYISVAVRLREAGHTVIVEPAQRLYRQNARLPLTPNNGGTGFRTGEEPGETCSSFTPVPPLLGARGNPNGTSQTLFVQPAQ